MSKLNTTQAFCEALLRADTEAEVIDILKCAGYWDDPSVWRHYGDQPENWATVGNQQSRPDHALVEKLTNAIDTKLIAAAKEKGVATKGPNAPESIFVARDLLFGEDMQDVESLSKSITVAATGARRRPSITIADDGEGQTPSAMPRTILSLHKGNKGEIPFVQGKFNMGGSGVLEFCGVNHNVELILSRRNPKLLPVDAIPEERKWSVTIIRRENPGPLSPRASRFTFLAPGAADAEGRRALLTFDAPTMPIFPEKNQAYVREAAWGTLFKMYEYGTRAVTNMMLADGLMMRLRLLLPEPALPIRFHECRDYSGDPNRSFDTPMAGLIYTLEQDRKNPKRQNVEWFDKFDLDLDGEKFTVRIYLFRKQRPDEKGNPADSYRKDEGVIFTYNGQCQAFFTRDFFRRKRVKQDYLYNSLLVFVDCSAIGVRAHEKLFMPNRESLRQGELKLRLERELEERLRDHSELEQIAIERRKTELSETPEASESFEKFMEQMVKKHPLLEKVLGAGFRISNPFKPHLVESQEKEWGGVRFPTKFHFRDQRPGETLSREAHLESDVRIAFETDAQNDYFRRDEQPGTFELYEVHDGLFTPAKNCHSPNLFNGIATVKLQLPSEAEIGSVVVYEAQVTDASRVEPFKNRFGLVVRAARPEPTPRPVPPKPPKVPTETDGDDVQTDTRLGIPKPNEVWQRDWGNQDPPFNKFTAITIKRPPGADENSAMYDYFVNMNNVWLDQAVKEHPKRVRELRERYKLGMTVLALSLVAHDLDVKKRQALLKDDTDNADEDEQETRRSDIRDVVAEVTSAIAPFLLPLVDTLSEITMMPEPLSAMAGEAA